MQIIPSILVQSKEEFLREIKSVQKSVDMVQLDIADGIFVPHTTWMDPDIVKKNAKIDVELHLMVSEPLKELKKWATVEQVQRIYVHFESEENLKNIMPTLHAYGWDIGIALNPDTPTSVLDPYIKEIKAVMFMGVTPGKQGQKLIPEVLEKMVDFISKNPNIFTAIDGAVNEETLTDIVKTGVKAICPGSAIFKNEREPRENVKRMGEIINRLTV
ncbi:MAG: hypothetical protein WCW16_01905 [Candidatus Magasanikbacteria bacterium]